MSKQNQQKQQQKRNKITYSCKECKKEINVIYSGKCETCNNK